MEPPAKRLAADAARAKHVHVEAHARERLATGALDA